MLRVQCHVDYFCGDEWRRHEFLVLGIRHPNMSEGCGIRTSKLERDIQTLFDGSCTSSDFKAQA
jgi:hypothetical protein